MKLHQETSDDCVTKHWDATEEDVKQAICFRCVRLWSKFIPPGGDTWGKFGSTHTNNQTTFRTLKHLLRNESSGCAFAVSCLLPVFGYLINLQNYNNNKHTFF